jgi:hypothetical protein
MTEQIDISKAGKQLASLVSSGQTYQLMRYGKIAAYLVPPEQYQMEHLATDAAHRPVPEALTVKNDSGAPMTNWGRQSTVGDVSGAPSIERQRAAQSARDDILRGVNRKGKS